MISNPSPTFKENVSALGALDTETPLEVLVDQESIEFFSDPHEAEATLQKTKFEQLRSLSDYLPLPLVEKHNVLLTDIEDKGNRKIFHIAMCDTRNTQAQEAVAQALKTTSFNIRFSGVEMMDFLVWRREAYPVEKNDSRSLKTKENNLQHSALVTRAQNRTIKAWDSQTVEEEIDTEGKVDLSDLREYERNIEKSLSELEPSEFCRLVIMDALLSRASDIHLEKQISTGRVRYRVDGVMIERWIQIPLDRFKQFVFNFANLASVNYVQTKFVDVDSVIRVLFPKQGRKQTINLRFSSAPTEISPSLVIRVQGDPIRDIDKLGFFPVQIKQLRSSITRPNGIAVVCGPTGGGKTNTLESLSWILEQLGEYKFYEIGDKYEFESDNRTQVNINSARGFGWIQAFKNALRQDPNVIILGECRSAETAETAFAAANSGHLVLTTVHAGTVEQALNRLLEELLIKPGAIADSLNVIVAQNLVPLLCTCKEIDHDHTAVYREKVYRAVGCHLCLGKGFRGRTVIGEVLLLSKDIKKMLYAGDSPSAIVKFAIESRLMIPMETTARLKVVKGITSHTLANSAVTMAQVYGAEADTFALRQELLDIESESSGGKH